MSIEAPNYRYNPFTGVFSPKGIGYGAEPVEEKTIPSSSPYWVFLDEIPRKDSPSTLLISGFTEVSFTTVPAAGQFRVVYGTEPDLTTGAIGQGIIEFSAADAGTDIEIQYYGLGAILQNQFFNRMLEGFWGDADTIQTGDLVATGNVSSDKSFDGAPIALRGTITGNTGILTAVRSALNNEEISVKAVGYAVNSIAGAFLITKIELGASSVTIYYITTAYPPVQTGLTLTDAAYADWRFYFTI